MTGMLSHVFRPMTTAFSLRLCAVVEWVVGAEEVEGTWLVTLRKKAMSALMPGQGRFPWNPMPMWGCRAVATTT